MKQLWLDCDMESPETFDLEVGTIALSSRCCPGQSKNENGALVVPIGRDQVVLAVADGCGGTNAGAEAARITLKAIKRSLNSAKENSLRSAILDGIEAANARVLKLGVGAATTLAVAEIDGDRVRTFHIGDSQIVLIGGRGRLKLQTPAHSPVGYAVEAGVLSETDAMTHEERHIVSNVVGTRACFTQVGMRRKLAKRDTLVLATDGVWDNLPIEEVCETIRRGSVTAAADELASLLRDEQQSEAEPSKPDDTTFILFKRR